MPPQPMPEVPGVSHRDVEVRGVRWHVAEAGAADAPPLVLLHGWPQHWYAWRRLIPELSRDFRVIAPDLPGFGWSDAPRGWSYGKHQLAGAVVDLLDVLGLDRVKLVGHDWGGWAGFLACVQAPTRIERYAGLSIPTPWMALDAPTPMNLARISYQFVLAAPVTGERIMRHAPQFIELVIKRGSHPSASWTPEELKAFSRAYQSADHARAASRVYRTFLTREVPKLRAGTYEQGRSSVPTLHLTGDADPVVTPDRLGQGADHIDSYSSAVVNRAGHFLAEEQPEAVLGHLRPFLTA